MSILRPVSRRVWLRNTVRDLRALGVGSWLCGSVAQAFPGETDFVTGQGAVPTPRFYRQDIGTAPGRIHEPTAGSDGNLWTSLLDGNLWQYDTQSGQTQIHDLEH